jgi:hypothetical protein
MTSTGENSRLPDDLRFEDWVNFVFNSKIFESQISWWVDDCDCRLEWNESAFPERTLGYMTNLFNKPVFLIESCSRRKIDEGFAFLLNNDHMLLLRDGNIPWSQRRECFDAMVPLFSKLKALVYQNDLGHLTFGAGDPEPPNIACYMWWDAIPLYGGMSHPGRDRINDAVLYVFEEVLKLKAESCLESALHGLGHWHLDLPSRTEPIIRKFLNRRDISDALRRYAECALTGCVQ